MPLNQPKNYAFVPNMVGPVRLMTRSSRRSRLWNGGSFWRSHERGEASNLIQISCVEDLGLEVPEGMLVVQNTVLKPDESIFVTGMPIPEMKLFELNLKWDEEIRVLVENERVVAQIHGIRWQIAGGPPSVMRIDLGVVHPNRLFVVPGVVAMKLNLAVQSWPVGAVLYLRPRTHRYRLTVLSVTDTETMTSTIGWDIQVLRGALNSSDTWVRMPNREVQKKPAIGDNPSSTPQPPSTPKNEDGMDDQYDAEFLMAFETTNMSGADGLPATPAGYNTGPDRALVHLNYSERDDGSMGEFNQVFEWVGESVTLGSWERY